MSAFQIVALDDLPVEPTLSSSSTPQTPAPADKKTEEKEKEEKELTSDAVLADLRAFIAKLEQTTGELDSAEAYSSSPFTPDPRKGGLVRPAPRNNGVLSKLTPAQRRGRGQGLTMLLSVVLACVQNVRYPLTKLTCLELMELFGEYVDDEVVLGRVIPYIVFLLNDSLGSVRAAAVKTLAHLLSLVTSFPSSDVHIFPEWIFPALEKFVADPDEMVGLWLCLGSGLVCESIM